MKNHHVPFRLLMTDFTRDICPLTPLLLAFLKQEILSSRLVYRMFFVLYGNAEEYCTY